MKLQSEKRIFRGDFGQWDASHRHSSSNKWHPLYSARLIEAACPVRHTCQYPLAITELFESATKRCPSISVNNSIMEGQPCIDGTRIPVRSLLRAVEHYGSIDGALTCYPEISAQNVKDALYFSQIVLELPSGVDEITATD